MDERRPRSGARPIRVRNLDTGEELLADAATGPLDTFRERPPADGTILRTSVSGTEQGLEDGRPFVRYIVDVAAVRPVGEWRVRRRYREFEALYTRLMDAGAGQVLDLRMPHKTWFFNKSPEVIEERRAKFTLMLNTCLAALHHLSPTARGHVGEFLALNDSVRSAPLRPRRGQQPEGEGSDIPHPPPSQQGHAALSAQLSALNRAAAAARATGAASPTADRVAALREGDDGATAVEHAAPDAISPAVSPIQPQPQPQLQPQSPVQAQAQTQEHGPDPRGEEPSPMRASLSGSEEEAEEEAWEVDVAAASRGAEGRWMRGAWRTRGGPGSNGAAHTGASSRAGELHAVFAVAPQQGKGQARRGAGRRGEGGSRGAFPGASGRSRGRVHSRPTTVHLRRALSDTEAQGGAGSGEEGKGGSGRSVEEAPFAAGHGLWAGAAASSGTDSATTGGEGPTDLHRQRRQRRRRRRPQPQQQRHHRHSHRRRPQAQGWEGGDLWDGPAGWFGDGPRWPPFGGGAFGSPFGPGFAV